MGRLWPQNRRAFWRIGQLGLNNPLPPRMHHPKHYNSKTEAWCLRLSNEIQCRPEPKTLDPKPRALNPTIGLNLVPAAPQWDSELPHPTRIRRPPRTQTRKCTRRGRYSRRKLPHVWTRCLGVGSKLQASGIRCLELGVWDSGIGVSVFGIDGLGGCMSLVQGRGARDR